MSSNNEFWLNVHRLVQAYDREGVTPDERAKNISRQLQEMPHLAQREVLHEFCRLVAHLPDLYTAVIAAASETERARAEEVKEHEKHEHEKQHEKVA